MFHDSAPASTGGLTHRPEAALRDLFTAHAGHVYATAVRCCRGRMDLAEEVTQAVFCEWMRSSATFPADVVPGGWLHRCTVYKSSEILRSEARRKQYERRAATQQSLLATGADDPHWRELAPMIDEILEHLPTADRNALILRFYERCDFREVGRRLGLSADTAQKRVSRALQRLKAEFARRGIHSTGGTLGSYLATGIIFAPPPGFLSSLTLPSLSPSTATLKTLTAIMSTNTKLGILGAGLCATLAITALIQHHTLADQKQSIRDLQGRLAAAGVPSSGPMVRSSSERRARTTSSGKDSAMRPEDLFAKALAETDPLKRMSEWTGLLQSMRKDEAVAVAEMFKNHMEDFDHERFLFLRSWGALDGRAAADFLKKTGVYSEDFTAVMAEWAHQDPAAAVAWLEANPMEKSSALVGITEGWARKDLASASRWVESQPGSQSRLDMLNVLFKQQVEQGGLEGAKTWFANIGSDPHNDNYRQRGYELLCVEISKGDPDAALQWLEQNATAAYARKSEAVDGVLRQIANRDGEKAVQWILDHPEVYGWRGRSHTLAEAVETWAKRETDGPADLLKGLAGTENYDPSVAAFASSTRARGLYETSLEWTQTIGDPETRERIYSETANRWLSADRENAGSYLRNQGYTAEEITKLAAPRSFTLSGGMRLGFSEADSSVVSEPTKQE
ncbi:sigma-70 family RNA polymerase sigma factor [Luteolibacter ambystomatis]|uniref:Sigma-70 family RNA polymerase sigma factor n=1 Tax=Luteolibacter ambystomatis TaxID=2824561 RepID=A0A975J349_9BACT|nr:sigma-70 family RNA polymerase sigma factor [Luteolibacter ambystomatis]QUE53133.1 sigma-70 family RNA polymerase sigma factor [Luteolibacter ambystomatis]